MSAKKFDSLFIKKKSCGFLRYPREDTYKVVTSGEKIFNLYKLENKLKVKNARTKLIVITLRNLNFHQFL